MTRGFSRPGDHEGISRDGFRHELRKRRLRVMHGHDFHEGSSFKLGQQDSVYYGFNPPQTLCLLPFPGSRNVSESGFGVLASK